MGERQFFVVEIPPYHLGWNIQLTSITESELLRRLNEIVCVGVPDFVGDEEIDVLLNGVKEQDVV